MERPALPSGPDVGTAPSTLPVQLRNSMTGVGKPTPATACSASIARSASSPFVCRPSHAPTSPAGARVRLVHGGLDADALQGHRHDGPGDPTADDDRSGHAAPPRGSVPLWHLRTGGRWTPPVRARRSAVPPRPPVLSHSTLRR